MERLRKGVAILLNGVWHSVVIEFRCVSSKILWNKFRFSMVNIYVVVEHGSNEGNAKERERF